MQWRFDREPCGKTFRLQFDGEFTREGLVAGGVDGKREAGAMRVENTRQQLKMSGEKNREC